MLNHVPRVLSLGSQSLKQTDACLGYKLIPFVLETIYNYTLWLDMNHLWLVIVQRNT